MASAFKARGFRNKTSNLHLSFKESLPQEVKELLTTELTCGYYHIDEGNTTLKIAVEIDGCYWHGCSHCGFPGVPYIKNTDGRKESYLKNRGWRILHIKECLIKGDHESCVRAISNFVLEANNVIKPD